MRGLVLTLVALVAVLPLRAQDSLAVEGKIPEQVRNDGEVVRNDGEVVRSDSLSSRPSGRATRERISVHFDYNAHFDWFFVNNEYSASQQAYGPSRTMTGLRLTPLVGLRIEQPNGMKHRLLAGIDIEKDFGANPYVYGTEDEQDRKQQNWNLFREIKIYYTFEAQFKKTNFSVVAGIFPRYETRGKYTTAILSDPVRFYDNNIEGLLLRFARPKSYYEVGLDWNGKYGEWRHEQFNIFSYGDVYILPWLHFGWQGMFHHYAGAKQQPGVVDDHLLNPYFTFDFAPMSGLQALNLAVGPFVGYQRDRRWDEVKVPWGVDAVTEIRHWNVGIRNEFYYGMSQMPYYAVEDSMGNLYGDRLYMRGAYWQVRTDPGKLPAYYDRLEAYWQPRISDWLRVRIAAVLHFNEGFSGWQQIATLVFDLDTLLKQRHEIQMFPGLRRRDRDRPRARARLQQPEGR